MGLKNQSKLLLIAVTALCLLATVFTWATVGVPVDLHTVLGGHGKDNTSLVLQFKQTHTQNVTFKHKNSQLTEGSQSTADDQQLEDQHKLTQQLIKTQNTTKMAQTDPEKVHGFLEYFITNMTQEKSRSPHSIPGPSGCEVTDYKTWETGYVTKLNPTIKANCALLRGNQENEIRRVQAAVKNWKNAESDKQFMKRMTDCSTAMEEFTGNFYVSQEEVDFPLAFSLMVYTAPQQVIRLLKTIYRPHNLYCIHPDARQSSTFISFFTNFSICFDNVFVASRLERVYYAHSSILEAQLRCMEDFIKYDRSRWRYSINMVGRELVIMTNRAIVKTLKERKGTSVVETYPIAKEVIKERFTKAYTIDSHDNLVRTQHSLGPVPHNIPIYKGSTHMALTRDFMEFILTNRKAIDFRRYMQSVRNAEESFYSSLYRLPEAASYGGKPATELKVPNVKVEAAIYLANKHGKSRRSACSGLVIHDFCIVACGDLSRIERITDTHLYFFMNKYFMDSDPVVADCTETRLVSLNKQEFEDDCRN